MVRGMIDRQKAEKFIKEALKEDIGRMDITSAYIIPSSLKIKADIASKSEGVLAGLPFVEMVYAVLDGDVRVKFNSNDGAAIKPDKAVCFLEGRAVSILKGERTALNILSRASGIATITRRYVDKAKGGADIFDTRKTTPNARYLEKYAVSAGGGKNHRMGLYDQVLIKDNHIAALKETKAGSRDSLISRVVKAARKKALENVKVELEVGDIAEFQEALSAGADIIMLDNMPSDMVREAVRIKLSGGVKAKRVILEASGNITLDNVSEYAKTGVDRISVGAITRLPEDIDFSLEVI